MSGTSSWSTSNKPTPYESRKSPQGNPKTELNALNLPK
jgi:hypothetical protein